MKALVIGAAGFVGNYLLRHLKTTYPWQLHATKLPHENILFNDASVHDLDILNKEAIQQLLIRSFSRITSSISPPKVPWHFHGSVRI